MKLQVSQLKEGENPFHFEGLKEPWLQKLMKKVEKEAGYHFSTPMTVDLKLTKLEPDYYLQGKLAFALEQPCSRCAENFGQPLTHTFELALSHLASADGRFKVSEESEELDITFFEGPILDLMPVVEEQFFLSVPLQSLCRTECKGLCQKCGKNLNHGPCSCKQIDGTAPFAVLGKIKSNK